MLLLNPDIIKLLAVTSSLGKIEQVQKIFQALKDHLLRIKIEDLVKIKDPKSRPLYTKYQHNFLDSQYRAQWLTTTLQEYIIT